MMHLAFAQRPPTGPLNDAPQVVVCPACGSIETEDVFRAGELPVNVGKLHETYSDAVSAPVGTVTLAHCSACGFVHNREFDRSLDVFRPGYEVALHHSEIFRNFITGVAERLVARFDLREKQILEIGCGDAYFLKELANLGANHCVGIDPTIITEGKIATENGTVRLIRDAFGSSQPNVEADFVCCLSVFEDIPDPGPFLAAVHALAVRRNAPLYFEVFNAARAFKEQEVWSVHYEQCNYFGLNSLLNLFARHGFKIQDAGTCYQDGQYLFVEATPVLTPACVPSTSARTDAPEVLRAYERAFKEKREWWNQQLSRSRNAGERVILWGTGGKGITFLNSVSEAHAIEFVVEINPGKQAKFVPGTGHRIVSPEFLADYQPHKIIITNALYEDEIKAQAHKLGVNAEFLIA